MFRQFGKKFSTIAASAASTHQRYRNNYKSYWTKDPATYPLMIIVPVALLFGVGMIASKLISDPDVKMRGAHRKESMRGGRNIREA
jgi:hypothetical protein